MTPEAVIELIKIIPGILWFVLVVILVARLYEPIKKELLPHLSELKVFGVEATFIREELEKATKNQETGISQEARSRVERRLHRDIPLLRKMRVLWVDDNPINNISEMTILLSVGVHIDVVTSTEEALSRLSANDYDLVISDIARDGVSDEGLRFLSQVRSRQLHRPIVFYAGVIDWDRGTPPYAFGITNRVDDLLHYVMDVAERTKI